MNDQLSTIPAYRQGMYQMQPIERMPSKNTVGQVSIGCVSQDPQATPFKNPSSRLLAIPFNPLSNQRPSKGLL